MHTNALIMQPEKREWNKKATTTCAAEWVKNGKVGWRDLGMCAPCCGKHQRPLPKGMPNNRQTGLLSVEVPVRMIHSQSTTACFTVSRWVPGTLTSRVQRHPIRVEFNTSTSGAFLGVSNIASPLFPLHTSLKAGVPFDGFQFRSIQK